MKEKEKLIMQSSMKLFAQKGFSSTSIQEIATDAGISKGSFYLYYKSKEALLVAIFNYFSHKFNEDIEVIKKKQLPPRETFVAEMIAQFHTFLEHKDFIIMHARESVIPANEEISHMINTTRAKLIHSLRGTLLSIYGEEIKPYLLSLTILVEGIFQSHLEVLLFSKPQLELNQLAHYMLKRTDDVAQGLMKSNEEPLLTDATVNYPPFCSSYLEQVTKDTVLQSLEKAKHKWHHMEDILITLEVLEEEINKSNPRSPVIQGMLGNLKKENDFDDLHHQISKLFHI
ncbi:TetR/AcrR family transcriptional regulator [Bacillus massiliigorillae]|uniref:TetR/AcrR family transcriptional regulator n=1 Tax=Bacillus massiliigorillae TaxID=1243664 RepID=UPI0003A1B225|nr:TetR/AcrR family transcriptional regulator [Bacillus massiliigorillae]